MNYLLHRDICAAFLRGNQLVGGRILQNRGTLHISAITVLDLVVWLLRPGTPGSYLQPYGALLQQVKVVDVTDGIAHRAATLTNRLRSQGVRLAMTASLVAATALATGMTLVTHSIQRFAQIPGIVLVDWLVP